MPISFSVDRSSANLDALSADDRYARPTVRNPRGRATDDDLFALLQSVGDLDELIVLDARLDRAKAWFAVVAQHVHHLVATLTAHGAQRGDDHVVLLVD